MVMTLLPSGSLLDDVPYGHQPTTPIYLYFLSHRRRLLKSFKIPSTRMKYTGSAPDRIYYVVINGTYFEICVWSHTVDHNEWMLKMYIQPVNFSSVRIIGKKI